FNGYTPGKYTIEFVWGNGAETSGGIQINPYDFKGTIYEESRLEQKDIWHKIDVDTRKNDAMDDMDIRGKLDDFSVNENGGIDYNVFENSRTADDIMISKTPIMNIEIEYTNDSDQISSYIIKNVDFGIIERPRQYLQLQKQLSKVDLVLQNGQLLVTSVRLPDGSMSSPEGVTYQGPSSYSNPPNGFLNIAIDSELLQGSTLNVEYTLQVKNMSEKDYTTENYYLYGIRSEDEMVVTLTPTILVDYLDNDFAFNESDNDKWEKIDLNDLRNKVSNTVCDADGIKDKRIIKTTSLNDKPLGPGYSSDIVTLKTKKLLSSKSVIELNNESEIIEFKTTGTRLTTTIPGNYVPGMMFETNGINEPDDDMAEGLTITPPTGKVINESLYMISTLLGIIIVGIGAITIKKKVL
ncbi:MAG: hypothetical protein HUJ68_00185, partial [Clostridia bacterium]|nr:hypothetical protein [Clostridia bacterium]